MMSDDMVTIYQMIEEYKIQSVFTHLSYPFVLYLPETHVKLVGIWKRTGQVLQNPLSMTFLNFWQWPSRRKRESDFWNS
jgi:hypothetical protein